MTTKKKALTKNDAKTMLLDASGALFLLVPKGKLSRAQKEELASLTTILDKEKEGAHAFFAPFVDQGIEVSNTQVLTYVRKNWAHDTHKDFDVFMGKYHDLLSKTRGQPLDRVASFLASKTSHALDDWKEVLATLDGQVVMRHSVVKGVSPTTARTSWVITSLGKAKGKKYPQDSSVAAKACYLALSMVDNDQFKDGFTSKILTDWCGSSTNIPLVLGGQVGKDGNIKILDVEKAYFIPKDTTSFRFATKEEMA